MTLRPNRVAYCTLNRIIQRANADSTSTIVSTTASQNAAIDTESENTRAELKDCIYKASDVITQAANNTFVPYDYTYTLDGYEWAEQTYYDRDLGVRIFYLPESLLSVTSFTWDGIALTSSQYRLRPKGRFPANKIAIDPDALTSYPDDFEDSIDLAGIWGYHPDPDNMWRDSGYTVQDNPLSASSTTLTVASGHDFATLQYIRIESEYLLITSVGATTLTVERGARGTTAASHALSTAIETFVPIEDIADETARLALRRFQLRSGIEVIASGETAFELKMGDVQLSKAYHRYYIRVV